MSLISLLPHFVFTRGRAPSALSLSLSLLPSIFFQISYGTVSGDFTYSPDTSQSPSHVHPPSFLIGMRLLHLLLSKIPSTCYPKERNPSYARSHPGMSFACSILTNPSSSLLYACYVRWTVNCSPQHASAFGISTQSVEQFKGMNPSDDFGSSEFTVHFRG